MLRKEAATPGPSQHCLLACLLLGGGTEMCRVGRREARQSRLGVQRVGCRGVKGTRGGRRILKQYPGHRRVEGYPERIRGETG